MFDSLRIKQNFSAMPKINKFKHRKTIMASTSFDENEDDAPFKFSF